MSFKIKSQPNKVHNNERHPQIDHQERHQSKYRRSPYSLHVTPPFLSTHLKYMRPKVIEVESTQSPKKTKHTMFDQIRLINTPPRSSTGPYPITRKS